MLTVFAGEIDLCRMHDGLIAASHRVRGTAVIISKDEAFANTGLDTVWD